MAGQMEFLGFAGAPKLHKVTQNGLAGIFHEEKGLLVLGDWDSIGDYRDGLAPVFKTDRSGIKLWGLIDETGNLITPCQWLFEENPLYPELHQCSNGQFVNGYALARDNAPGNDGYRIMTPEGKLIGNRCWAYFEELFDREKKPIRVFFRNDNSMRVISYLDEEWCYNIDSAYWLNLPADCTYENCFYYLTYDGTVLTPEHAFPADSTDELPEGWEELPKFTGSFVNPGPGKYINALGQFCLGNPTDPNAVWWDEVAPQDDATMLVRAGSCWGMLDSEGNQLIPCQWEEIDPTWNDMLIVKRGGKYGVIFRDGRELIPCRWEELVPSYNDMLIVRYDGKYGVISRDGKEIIPCSWDSVHRATETFRVCRDGMFGLLDHAGNQILPCQYEAISFNLGWITVKQDGLWGILDRFGHWIHPCRYEQISNFKVKQGGLWGLLDYDGRQILPCQWREIWVDKSCIRVKKGGLWALLDKEGNMLTPRQWEYLDSRKDDSLYIAKKDGKWGLLNPYGRVLSPAQWDSLTFSPVHSICVSRNGRYGLISYDGSEILPCAYEWISGCADPAMTVVKDNKWGALSFYGDWITPCEWDSLCFQKDYRFGYTWIITRKGEQQYTLDLEGNLLK